jgi:hypothetical protein
MSTINANTKQTLNLAAGSVLSVAAPSGTTGLVVRLSRIPGGDTQSVTTIAGANLTFGPYAYPERFEVICTAGTVTVSAAPYDPASDTSDAELVAALAALLSTSLSGSDATHAPTVKAVFDALALKANLTAPAFVSVGLPKKTPVNATPTMLTLPVADLAILEAGDTIVFEEVTCTKAAEAGAGEFNSAAELAALLNAIAGWTGAEDSGIVTAVSDALGAAENGTLATITHLGATTSGGSAEAKAAGKLLAAELARLTNGDTVTFDGSTFTKAAATSVPAGTFADVAGLILCIDGMEDWAAVLNGSDIDITAAANGAESNDISVNLIYLRASAGAINGTVGVANEMCADDSYIYHSVGASLVSTANWRRIARGSAF